jgi:hypothetical protein
MAYRLQVWVLFVRKWHIGSILHLLLVLLEHFLVDLDFRRSKSGRSDEFERLVADELPGEPAAQGLAIGFRWLMQTTYRKGFSKL